MVVAPPLWMDAGQPRDQVVRQAMITATAFLEERLRDHPTQWLNFFNIWPEDVSPPAATQVG
jgi:predicted LPLAT superfamily acyltransferase